MEVTALCISLLLLLTVQIQSSSQEADAAFPYVDPNRLQFFEYESISLSCVDFHGPTEWRVIKKIPSVVSQWETAAVLLNIKPTFKSHSGEYWCENDGGERSSALNITVTDGNVILDIPALPVIEQQAVALHCRKKGASSNSPADFFKDGSFIKTDYKGMMNIPNISISDQGLYKCEISGAGKSPESWLAVRAQDSTTQVDQNTHHAHRGSVPTCHIYLVLRTVLTIVTVALLLLLLAGLLHFGKLKVE